MIPLAIGPIVTPHILIDGLDDIVDVVVRRLAHLALVDDLVLLGHVALRKSQYEDVDKEGRCYAPCGPCGPWSAPGGRQNPLPYLRGVHITGVD